MISIITGVFNRRITQKLYDTIIHSLNISSLRCPKCGAYHFVLHGYYSRRLKSFPRPISLVITRLKCSSCHSTHALLPDFIVPYSSLPYAYHIAITNNEDVDKLMIENPYIDENTIRCIRRSYRAFYREFLRSFLIPLNKDTSLACLRLIKRTFNQNRWRKDNRFDPFHIALFDESSLTKLI